ncbi:g10840 [Coccomyxa elongata]
MRRGPTAPSNGAGKIKDGSRRRRMHQPVIGSRIIKIKICVAIQSAVVDASSVALLPYGVTATKIKSAECDGLESEDGQVYESLAELQTPCGPPGGLVGPAAAQPTANVGPSGQPAPAASAAATVQPAATTVSSSGAATQGVAANATAVPVPLVNSTDVAALRLFAQSTGNSQGLLGSSKSGFKGWDFTTSPCQGWTGITCNLDGRITKLDLGGWNIVGRLTPELSGLDQLQLLNVSGNNFTGGLSSTWGAPGVFPNLVTMDLSQNYLLGGILLTQWGTPGSFPKLETLKLVNTGLTGQLPVLWGVNGSFPSLSNLDASRNIISGPLPASWATPGALQSLSTLVLSANNLSGSLPPEWGANGTSFVKLAKLDVRQNGLGGYLPDLWGPGFKSMEVLELQENNFIGELPMSWAAPGRFPALGWLDLWKNSLSGSIPATWGNWNALPSIRSLAIRPGNSDMCGWVPDRLANVTGLKTGYLGNCSALPPPRPRPIIQPVALAPAPAPIVSAFSILTQAPVTAPAAAPAVALLLSPVAAPAAAAPAAARPLPDAMLPAAGSVVGRFANLTAPANATTVPPVLPVAAVPAPAPILAPAVPVVAPSKPAVAPVAAPVIAPVVPLIATAPAPAPVTVEVPVPAPVAAPVAAPNISAPAVAPLAAPVAATPPVTPPATRQDVGAGAAALAQAAAAMPPSPRPQQPKRTPAPAATDSASAASPAADSPVSSFIPPTTDPNTVYLQASYNLTGTGLDPTSATTRKRIQTALRKTLGNGVNATLLDVSGPGSSSADATAADATSADVAPDATIAGAGRRLLRVGSSIAGVDNADASPAADAASADAASADAPSTASKKKTTLAARFVLTTTPDQMAVVARDVAADTTASKFEQQLKTAGLPNTRSVFTDVSQIGPDGTLTKVQEADPSASAAAPAVAAAAPLPATKSSSTPLATPLLTTSATPSPTPSPTPSVSGFLTGSPTYLTAAASPASASSGGAPSKPNGGAIAGGVIGALLAVLLAGFGAWYYTKRKYAAALLAAERKAGSSEGQEHLAKGEDHGGSRRGPLGGQLGGAAPANQGGVSPREANPDKVAAMLAAMKADAARARSQRLPSLKLPDKPGPGQKDVAPAAGDGYTPPAVVAAGKAEDSANEHDDKLSEVSDKASGSAAVEEQSAADAKALEKGKGKMVQGRRTDSASSLRSVITDPSGQIVAEIAGPSSSSDASGSTAGSTVESLSGSEGMAPIQTMMLTQGAGSGDKYAKEAGTPQSVRSGRGGSGAKDSRAPLSPHYLETSRSREMQRARSGNILQHLAAELRRAEAAGGMERLMSSGGNLPRGTTYPAAGHGVRRRQSDPDFLAQIAGGQQQPQSRHQTLRMLRLLEEREYQAASLARARSGGGRTGNSRHSLRDDLGIPIQGMSRSGSGIGMHEARGLEHRLGSRGSGVCFVDMRQVQGGGGGRNRSAALAGIERLNSGGSEQRLYRGQRSDGLERANSSGSGMSYSGLEAVGEHRELGGPGGGWGNAMKILGEMERDMADAPTGDLSDRMERRARSRDMDPLSGSGRRSSRRH